MSEVETDLTTGPLPGLEEVPSPEEPKKRRGRPPGSVNKKKILELESEVSDRIREYVAIPLGMLSPLGCAVLDARADRTAKALCRVAQTSPRMRRALLRFVEGSAWVDVSGTLVAVTIAIGVDFHRFEPNSMPARFAKVPEAWQVVYPGEPYWTFSQNGGENADIRGLLAEDDM